MPDPVTAPPTGGLEAVPNGYGPGPSPRGVARPPPAAGGPAGRPAPVAAPPTVGLEDVTNGYVPWSLSRRVAWPPSSRTFSWRSRPSPSLGPGARGTAR